MSHEEKNMGDLFVVKVTNKNGEKAFYCEMPDGDNFCEKICLETRLFKTWGAAKMKANQLNKYGTAVVMKMSMIIDNPKLAEECGLTKSPKDINLDEMYFMTGYSDDGIKHWIHFSASERKYYADKQVTGACLWKKENLDENIKRLESNESITIKKITAEKVKQNEKN